MTNLNVLQPGDPQGLNRLNANFQYLQDKTNALQEPPAVVASQAEMLALNAAVGNVAIRTDITDASNQFILTALPASDIDNWMQLPMPVSPVNSVNGQTGNIILDASQIVDPNTGLSLSESAEGTNIALLQADRLYAGQDLGVKFATEIAESPFSGNIWTWIQNRIRTGNYSGIHVSDFITFTANGGTVRSEVAGINTYTRSGTPVIGNHIDFISRDLFPGSGAMYNFANYNNGTTVSPSPWLASNLFAWLNSVDMQVPNSASAPPLMTTVSYSANGVWNTLPAALQEVIVQKVALIPSRYLSGNRLTDDNSWAVREIGRLWLPSEMEVYGTTVWGSNLSPNQGWSSGGCVQYPIFANNMKRAKVLGPGARSMWWLLNARGGDAFSICAVNESGFAFNWNPNSALRFPLCFRIA